MWAHNSHLGDASATEMSDRGEWNVGQLMRDRHGPDAVRFGFSTHHGWVTVCVSWPSRCGCNAPSASIYRPETERQSHYFHTRLPSQFDALIHIHDTSALEPLGNGPVWSAGEEAPETFPSGI